MLTGNGWRLLYILIVLSTGLFGQSSKRPFLGWAVLQGPTTDLETVFAVMHKKGGILSACAGTAVAPCSIPPKETVIKNRDSSDKAVTHFRFQIAVHAPEFNLTIKGSDGEKDERVFSMAKPMEKMKFAVVSCMDDGMTEIQVAMWSSLLAKNPDVIFFIGDNVYTDKVLQRFVEATPAVHWQRYAETRETLKVFRSKKLIPIYAVWDDHDYGVNDGNAFYRYKDEAKDTFFAFFPQYENATFKRGPGVASILQMANQDFIFLDDRTFRSKDKIGDAETHWGTEQEEWLWKNLGRGKDPAWLINGDQLYGGYHSFESYEGRHPNSFKKFLKRLTKVEKPVNFITGDRHLTEIMKIEKSSFGREAYEFTSSGIHAAVFPDSFIRNPSPRQIAGAAGVYNYMIIESSVASSALKLSATAFGQDKVIFTKDLMIKR